MVTETSRCVGSEPGRARPPVLLLVAVALVSAVTFLGSTQNGLVITSDSVVFLDAAQNLVDGHGLVLSGSYPNLEPTLHGRSGFPLVHWPPLYPTAVGAADVVFNNQLDGARWLQALLLAANVALFGFIVWRLTLNGIGSVAGAAAFALSPAGLERHLEVASEPLFLFLTMLGFELLATYLTRWHRRLLVAAMTVLALALLTRYAGLPIVIVVFLALTMYERGPLVHRLVLAVSAALVVCLPLAAWLVRNASKTGTATGRDGIGWHPPGSAVLESAIGHLAAWFAPAALPPAARALAAATVGVAAILGIFVKGWLPVVQTHRNMVRVTILVGFAAIYLAFLFTSRTVADAFNPLNDRGFAPAYMALAIVGTAIVIESFIINRGQRTTVVAAAGTVVVILIVGAYALNTAHAIRSIDTSGYGSDRWRHSPALAAVKALSPARIVYSNHPEAIFLATGRRALSIPVRVDPIADHPYARYRENLDRLRIDTRRRHAVVVLFTYMDRPYLPDREQLIAQTGIRVLRTLRDGEILGAGS